MGPIDPMEHTEPGNRGPCSFCKGKEDGYAMPDKNGVFKPVCFKCLRKAHPPDYSVECKRKVSTDLMVMEDLDTDELIAKRDRATKRAAKRVVEEEHDNVPDSTVHQAGAGVVAEHAPATERREVGSDGRHS